MSTPAAVDAARRIIAQLDADEPVDWHAEAAAAGLTVYRMQLLVRHVWLQQTGRLAGDTPEPA